MITKRPAKERGHTAIDWLDSWHTFSFGEYHDHRHRGFRQLLVINDDTVAPANGFPPHSHENMEIISYVLEGQLAHNDSVGTVALISPGEVQRMTAGTGVQHAEYNPSKRKPVHFLQIWILPEARNLQPSYEQKAFPPEERKGKLRLVAARDGRDGAITVHQDVALWAGMLEGGDRAELAIAPGRHAWVQMARGEASLYGSLVSEAGGLDLAEGDGAQVSDEALLTLVGKRDAEVLVFDLA